MTLTLLYEVETWGLSLNKANNRKDLERPLVSMIAWIYRQAILYGHTSILCVVQCVKTAANFEEHYVLLM